jgi:WD40 repeat protein
VLSARRYLFLIVLLALAMIHPWGYRLSAMEPPPGSAELEPERTDRFDDPLPPGALARFGTLRLREGTRSHIRAVYSPATHVLAASGQDSCILLWDMATGKQLRQITTDDHTVGEVVFSADGKLLAVSSRARVVLFETATGKEVLHTAAHKIMLEDVAISPDGKHLASLDVHGILRLWDSQTGELRHELLSKEIDCRGSIVFSPDSKLLVVRLVPWTDRGKNTSLRFWDTTSGKEQPALAVDMPVGAFALSPDGRALAAVGEQFRVFDLVSQKEVRRVALPGTKDASRLRAAFSPDGKTLAASVDQTVFLWEAVSGKELRRFRAITAWYMTSDASARNCISTLAFAADSKSLITWGNEDRGRVFDVATGDERLHFDGHDGEVGSIEFMPDGKRILSSASDGFFRLWEAATGKELQRYGKLPAGHVALRLSSDHHRLVSRNWPNGEDKPSVLNVWDAGLGKELYHIDLDKCYWLDFSPDNALLSALSLDNRTLHLWRADTGKELPPLKFLDTTEGTPPHHCFAPGTKLLAAIDGDVVRVWELTLTGKHRQIWSAPLDCPEPLFAIADGPAHISPRCVTDGKVLVVVCYGRRVRSWDIGTGRESPVKWNLGMRARHLALSADGRALAAADEACTIKLWETATGKERCEFAGHQGRVNALGFSPDGNLLASGGEDRTALVWDLTLPAGKKPPREKPVRTEQLWQDLASGDAAEAHRALCQLVRDSGSGVTLLREKLRPVPAVPTQRVKRLLQQLEAESYAEREEASMELEKMGDAILPALRGALARKPSLEAQKRLERLVEHLESAPLTAEKVRETRAVEALERIGTVEARHTLAALAKGTPGARLTREARESLERLTRRSSPRSSTSERQPPEHPD